MILFTQEIIEFTQLFEQRPYAHDIVINNINERMINGNRAFNFTIAGLNTLELSDIDELPVTETVGDH